MNDRRHGNRARSHLGLVAAPAVALAAILFAAGRADSAVSAAVDLPTLTPQDIEANWGHQEQLRGSGAINAQAVEKAVARGRLLAGALKRHGVDLAAALKELDRLATEADTTPAAGVLHPATFLATLRACAATARPALPISIARTEMTHQ